MPGTRKRTQGGSPVQRVQREMAERKKGLKAENVVLGNSHLPPEMHAHIFNKLGSVDKITFSGALTTWHELVSKERPDFLCSKGAPILIEHLPQKALLQFRTLSRSWTQALDHHYQEHPDHVRLPFEIVSSWKKQIPKLANCFRSADTIQKFLEDMREHPGNPFPGSNVQLIAPSGPARLETERFWNNAFQVLKQFGQHVSYVQLTGFILGPCFRNCLDKLPYLKRLSISESGVSFDHPIRPYPSLPRLRNLETLEIGFVSQSSFEIILNFCPIPKNMKRLSIKMIMRIPRIPEVVYSFINLEVLKGHLIGIQDLQRFSELAKPPPLKEIEVGFRKETEAHQVFRALEPFANTLIHFKSGGIASYDRLTWINTDINLPNLRKLNLGGFNGSIDPFIKFTSLADLTVTFFGPTPYKEKRQVELYGFTKSMKDSNIWTLIPSLKRFTVEYTTYYRPLPPKQNRRSKRKCVLNIAKRYV